MKNQINAILLLSACAIGSANAAIVNLNLTGKVNYAYGNGVNQGDTANMRIKVDTSVAPSYNYSYNWSGFSLSENIFNSSVSSFSGKVGNQTFSDTGGTTVGYTVNENWYGNTYSAAEIYNYSSNGSGFKEFGVVSSGNNPINTQDLVSALLSGGNGLSFFFYNYDYSNWSSYMYAGGTFDNIKVSNTPIPAAVWLFGSGAAGLMGMRRKKTLVGSLATA